MKKLHIRPIEGFVVPDPATGKPISKDGAKVDDTNYWRRRIRTGVVIDLEATRQKDKSKDEKKSDDKPKDKSKG